MMTTTHPGSVLSPRVRSITPVTWLRFQYLCWFVIGTLGGAAIPGAMLGLLLGGPYGLILGIAPMLPFGLFVALPVMSIWLWGAMGTASAIERLHR